MRGLLGIGAREKDYGQSAVICNVTPEVPHGGRAFERMTPVGPFAILPHVGERCGLVWCAPRDQAAEMLEWDEETFLRAAEERSGGVLGRFLKIGRRSAYPLRLVEPQRDTDLRVAILGNAAHAIHPVGAQGFNLGLRDVAVLAELLAEARATDVDPGADSLLAAYAEWRAPDRDQTIAWTDTMVGLFSSDLALVRGARSAAMLAHALSPALRRRLASRAMGYRGRIPRLALGQPLAQTWRDGQ
ncbi:MAG: FAD-dependent monooxygenase [Gammaproteobacteria bacterium]